MGKMIKFDHVNEHGDFEKLLSHFRLDYEKTGTQLRALCPFHDDTNPSLSVALEATNDAKPNTWHCFGCKQSGSIIDFAALFENCTLREGAELVADVSGCSLAPAKAPKPKKPQKDRGGPKRTETGEPPAPADKPRVAASADAETPSEVNPPLKFTLPLDPEHEAVLERVSPGLGLTFGLGVCDPNSRSMMAGRLCVPIHNRAGDLIAYAGRYLGDERKEPKWLLPKGFEKSQVLFNAHRVAGASTVVLVEGFFDAVRLHGLGVPAVACMGTSISKAQIALLRDLGTKRVLVLFDGDDEGQAAVSDVVLALSISLFARVGTLRAGEDPASASEDGLKAILQDLLW